MNKIFHGSAELLLATLVENREFSDEEIERMRFDSGSGPGEGGREMIFWMGYAAVVGLLLAAGGWAGERLCETMGWPRRFPWIVALTLAVVIPLSARAPGARV